EYHSHYDKRPRRVRDLSCGDKRVYLSVRRFLAAQAARFAQFFRVCAISRSSASFAELGSIVAFSMARRNTWIIWRNDHSLSQSPIRPRNSSASADSYPAVIYHTITTLCIDHTHGANFSTLSRLQCWGASMSITCLLARNSTSIAHLQANMVITHDRRACRSVVNK